MHSLYHNSGIVHTCIVSRRGLGAVHARLGGRWSGAMKYGTDLKTLHKSEPSSTSQTTAGEPHVRRLSFKAIEVWG